MQCACEQVSLYDDDYNLQTMAYRAPEVLMGCQFGAAIDTYSLGVLLLELVLGRPLFHGATTRTALHAQTVCAFGPLPQERFKDGKFYGECY
jgi:serine/threonine protein kinase